MELPPPPSDVTAMLEGTANSIDCVAALFGCEVEILEFLAHRSGLVQCSVCGWWKAAIYYEDDEYEEECYGCLQIRRQHERKDNGR